jgi:Flp pilus assembly protein TadG
MNLLRLFRDCKASVAPLAALAAIPLFTGVGAAIDYSRANLARAAMQGALDASAIMLAKDTAQSSGGSTGSATTYFNANFTRSDVQDIQVGASASPANGGNSLALSATGSIKTQILGLIGFSSIKLSVNSGAIAYSDGLGCVLALDRTASGSISAQGTTSTTLNGCSLYDNSNNSTALTAGGSAHISALSVGVVGGISGADNIVAQQGILTGAGLVDDPYADVSIPNFTACTQMNFTAKTTVTINPGVYCNGMSINAGANVTLNPGTYYLDGGGLSVNGGATMNGTGVTLVFTKKNGNTWPAATINGNATINLTPPTYGPMAGIVVFGDRNIPVGTTFKFNGGSTQYFGGAIYVPTGAINFAGGNGTSTSCTQIIGDTVTFVGNSSVAINCSSFGTKPFSPLVIRLSS